MKQKRKIRFDPTTSDEEDLMRQNMTHKRDMEDALLKGQVERAANAWERSDQLVARLEEVRACKGREANRAGRNGPLHGQDTEIGHLTPGEVVIPLSAQTPQVIRVLEAAMGDALRRYTVGSGAEQRHPQSGLPAYFGAPMPATQNTGFQSWPNQMTNPMGSAFQGSVQPTSQGPFSSAATTEPNGFPTPQQTGASVSTPPSPDNRSFNNRPIGPHVDIDLNTASEEEKIRYVRNEKSEIDKAVEKFQRAVTDENIHLLSDDELDYWINYLGFWGEQVAAVALIAARVYPPASVPLGVAAGVMITGKGLLQYEKSRRLSKTTS